MLLLIVALSAGLGAALGFDCTFAASYPKQYVAYKTNETLVLDGKLDDPAWQEVEWTDRFVDISTTVSPRLSTHAKIRWDDEFLYVGALLEEPQAFANITSTCHCLNASQDQVIFHDNDFEIFVDAPGTTHYYKEFEINALNATWDLQLNRAYDDGGGENSSRVYGPAGWDYPAPIGGPKSLHAATFVAGTINAPTVGSSSWSVEVALPLSSLVQNTAAAAPPTPGSFWRINFSRVEWAVKTSPDGSAYWKEPSCQSCPVPGAGNEDNWVWSPQGSIAMHLPEKWGMLQFATGTVNMTAAVTNGEWPVRAIAAAVYYAEHAYAGDHNGTFTERVDDLVPYLADAAIVDGTCTGGAPVILGVSQSPAAFVAAVPASTFGDGFSTATINQVRFLQVGRA